MTDKELAKIVQETGMCMRCGGGEVTYSISHLEALAIIQLIRDHDKEAKHEKQN